MKTADITVEFIDSMGTDLSVVNAARVSFEKESKWEFHAGEQEGHLAQADAKLIAYLAKHAHWSPFAHTSVQLRCKAPIFLARQLVKHQVGGVWNEVSRRYVDHAPEFWIPEEVRGRPEGSVKQGSGAILINSGTCRGQIWRISEKCLQEYNFLLSQGAAPEMARMVLPLNTMTEWYWTGSLMFWARVCRQRLDAHAQKEARDFAKLVDEHCRTLFPVSWEALMKD